MALEEKRNSVNLEKTDYLLSQMGMDQKNLSVVSLVTSDSVFHESTQVVGLFILAFFDLYEQFCRHLRMELYRDFPLAGGFDLVFQNHFLFIYF